MKLHLPGGLRAALMACFAVVTGLATTLSTATITGGVFAVAIAGYMAHAADYQAAPADGILLPGQTYQLTSADNGMNIQLQSPSEWWGPVNHYHGLYVEDDVTVNSIDVKPGTPYVGDWEYMIGDYGAKYTEYTKLGGGTLTITNAPINVGRPYKVTVQEGTLVIAYRAEWQYDWYIGTGGGFSSNNVEVNAGATLRLAYENALGDEKSEIDSGCFVIALNGESGKLAKMEVNDTTRLYHEIALNGYAYVGSGEQAVPGSGLVSYEGKSLISAKGGENTVASDIRLNANLTIDVIGEGSTLDFSGDFSSEALVTAKLIKKGDGTLILSGTDSHLKSTLELRAGELLNTGVTSVGTLDVVDGDVSNSGTLSVDTLLVDSGSVTNAGVLNLESTELISGGITNRDTVTFDSLTQADGTSLVNSAGGYMMITGQFSLAEAIANNGTLEFVDGAQIKDMGRLMTTHSNGDGTVKLNVHLATGGTVLGVDKLFSGWKGTYADGFFSFHCDELVFAGSDNAAAPTMLVWDYETESFTHLDKLVKFKDDAWAVFTGYTHATVTETINASGIEVAKDSILTLTCAGNEVNASVIKLDGTLEFADIWTGKADAWTGSADAAVVISWGASAEDTAFKNYIGNMVVRQGSLELTSNAEYRSVKVERDGHAVFTQDYAGDVILVGNGCEGASGAAELQKGVTLSGLVTIDNDVPLAGAEAEETSISVSSGTAMINNLHLEGQLIKIARGTLLVKGNVTGGGGVLVEGGTISLGDSQSASGTLDTGDISVKPGATLYMHHASGSLRAADTSVEGGFRAANLTLEGDSNMMCWAMDNDKAANQWGTLTVNGAGRIHYMYAGRNHFEELKSAAEGNTLTLRTEYPGGGVEDCRTLFDVISNYDGIITQVNEHTSVHTLEIRKVSQSAGKKLSVTGPTRSDDFVKAGQGLLRLQALTLDGRILMNYEGTLVGNITDTAAENDIDIAQVLTLQNGSTLVYSNTFGDGLIKLNADHFKIKDDSGNVIGNKTLHLDVSALSMEVLAVGYDTGITGVSVEDAVTYFTPLSYLQYGINENNSLIIKLNDNYHSVTCDERWADTDGWGDTKAPLFVLVENELQGKLYLSDSQYCSAGCTAIEITGTAEGAENVAVFGGHSFGSLNLSGGSWIKVSGGNLEMVAGGNEWDSFMGDDVSIESHIYVDEAATVAHIVGATTADGGTLVGDTYITVNTSNITGMIVGGALTRMQGGVSLKGDTNIYINKVLEQNTAGSWSDLSKAVAVYAVIGGHVNLCGDKVSQTLVGDTNITVDFNSNVGAEAAFVKMLVGSSYLWANWADGNLLSIEHQGDSCVSVANAAGVTFSEAVVGDSFLAPGGLEHLEPNLAVAMTTGNCFVSLSGGTYTNYVMGGAYIYGDGIFYPWQHSAGVCDSVIKGSTNVTLNGTFASTDTFESTVVGGSVVAAAHSSSTIGTPSAVETAYSTNLTLLGGSYVNVVGGDVVTGTGSSSTLHNGSSVVVNDGTIVGTLVGGSWVSAAVGVVAEGETAPAVTQGKVFISMQGGKLAGDVYAAGMQRTDDGAITMTTAKTTVEISNDVIFEGNRSVSGAYNEGAKNAEVTGTKTLSFTTEGVEYTKLGSVLFRDFDTVSVAANSTLELNGFHDGETPVTQSFAMLMGESASLLTKTGAGTLVMGSNMQGASVNVRGGTLKLDTSLTSVTVNDGAKLDASTSAGRLGSLTLNGRITLNVNGDTGVELGTYGETTTVLTLGADTRITLTGVDTSAERIVLFTGISQETISGLVFETSESGLMYTMLSKFVNDSASYMGGKAVLALDGNQLVIASYGSIDLTWYWMDRTGGIWKDDTPEEGDWNQLASPAGAPVVFGNEGMGSATDSVTTITIEGNVTPESVQVNATRGSYVFTGTGSIVDMSATEPTSLTKSGASTLRIETANSYSGGTTLTGGVLEVANADALGKGVTRFNGGTLAYDLDEVHTTVTGDELALFVGYTGTVNVALVGGPTDAAENITWDFSDGASKAVLGADQHVSGEGMLTLHAIGSAGDGKSMTIAAAATAAEGTTPATVGTTVKLTGSGITFAYSLKGQGTLEVASTGITTISGNNSGFGGTILLTASPGSEYTSFASNAATGGTATTLALNGTNILHATTAGGRYEAGTVALTGTNVLDGYTRDYTRYIFAGDFVGGTTDSLLVRPGCTVEFEGSMADFSGTIGHDTQGNYADRTYVFRFVGKTPEGGEANTCKPSAGGDIFGAGAKLDVTGMNTTVTYEFAYSNKALNMNATVTGNANVTQSGTGTLVLTQANTATGTLTVNSGIVAIGTEGSEGSVGNWSGDADVNGTGELHLVNVTGGALAGAVTADADSTVKLQNSNGLTSISGGKLVVDGGSSAVSSTAETALEALQLVNGGSLSIGGDLAVKGSITSGGEGYEAGGDLSVGGKLTIGSVNADGMRSDSRMNIGGALSGVTKLNILGNLGPLPGTTDALITADSFAAVDKKLTVAFEREEQVSYINMSIGETYTLLSTTKTFAAFDSLTLQAGATTVDTESAAVLVDGMKYSLVAGTNSIVLKASFNGLEWTSTDGRWDTAEDWNGTLPSATSNLGLVGGGTAGVEVAVARQANSLRVDTAGAQGANAVTAYTLSGSGSLSMDSALLVSSGSLTIDALNVKSEGSTVIGSLTRPEQEATLSVGEKALSTLPTDLDADTAADEFATVGKLETGSLTLQSAAGSFTNNGLTSVTGALITELADGQCLGLTNNGMLQMGDKSNVGTITGSGVVWATGGIVTVAALDGAALAKASGGATLSVGRVNNALGFSLVDDTSSISILEGDVTATSLNSKGGLLNIDGKLTLASKTSSGGRVKAGSVDMAAAAGSTLTSLQTGSLTLNLNTLAVGSPLLTLTDNVRNALGEAQTSSIKLTLTGAVAADGVAGMDLSTFTYDNQSNLGTRCNEQATLSDGSTYLREWTEYTLVDVTAANSLYSWDLSGTDLAELQQRFAEENGSYAQLTATDGGDIVLKVYKDDLREWNGGDVFDAIDKTVPAESASRWAGTITNAGGEVLDLSQLGDTYTALDSVELVNITEKETLIDLTELTNDATANPDGLLINHLSGADAESTLTLKGDAQDLATLRNDTLRYATADEDKDGIADTFAKLGSTSYAGTLVIEGMKVKAEGVLGEDGKPANSLEVGTTQFAVGSGSWLNVDSSADYRTGGLVSKEKDYGKISGTITVTGTAGKGTVSNGTLSGGYSGSYSNAIVALADGADQRLVLDAGANELSLISDPSGVTSAKATLSYTEGNADMGTITVTNTHLTLDNMGSGVMNTLGVAGGSTMTGGTLTFSLNAADIAAGLAGTAGTPVITDALSLKDTTVIVNLADGDKAVEVDLSGAGSRKTLFTLSENGTVEGLTAENIQLNGAFFNRYFDLSTLTVENGAVIADVVTNYYTNRFSQSENGTAGLQMLDAADLELAPQGNVAQYKDLAGIMDALQGFKASEAAAADKLAAAVAGSGIASLGMALSGDVERQLKTIRNRTTTMGVDPSVVNEDMPYFNAWINAEGDYRSMDDGGTLAGYTVNSYGGTVGFDMDVTPELTWGIALTAMYGDFESTTVDKVDGDMDTYYVSAFARATHGAWTHTFVATVGMSQSELSRTVSHKYGSYTAEGEADGMSFGFLYEAARTYALNEDATACWQPVFNVSFRHISVDGYEEEGSDAALKVGDQSLNTLTFGLGGRLQSIVGENVYNRTSIFEARALVKFDVGDRESEVENALINAPSATATVKSAELDTIGLEVGAGLTVPVGFDAGSIFVDGSLEFRGSYTNFNAAAGYRVNF